MQRVVTFVRKQDHKSSFVAMNKTCNKECRLQLSTDQPLKFKVMTVQLAQVSVSNAPQVNILRSFYSIRLTFGRPRSAKWKSMHFAYDGKLNSLKYS